MLPVVCPEGRPPGRVNVRVTKHQFERRWYPYTCACTKERGWRSPAIKTTGDGELPKARYIESPGNRSIHFAGGRRRGLPPRPVEDGGQVGLRAPSEREGHRDDPLIDASASA
jgi:hypothetical protein